MLNSKSEGEEGLTSEMLGRELPVPLSPPRTGQAFDQRRFLALLNFKDPAPSIRPGGLQRIAWAASAQASVAGYLRTWVDDWLESGRSRNGWETPTNRTFSLAKKASEAVYNYSKMGRGNLLGVQNSLELWFNLYSDDKVSVGGLSRIAPPR